MAATRGSAPGLELASHKRAAMARRIAPAPVPAQALVALDQGNGRSATPCVRIGERVRLGSLLARADTEAGTDLHAPVAGRVRAIEPLPSAPETGHAIVIDNDGTDERDPANEACPDYAALAPAVLLERIRRAGIAGLGGAAYPTATKLERSRAGAVTHLVLNGAECEPWICCDDALMRERADDVVLGAQAMLHACGASRCTIAIEDDTPEAGASLRAALAAAGDARLSLAVLPALYPAGAERQLLTSITGIEVPQHGWPPDVGLLCQNVGTAAAVARLVQAGEPLIRRIVTVTGSGVATAGNFEARIGTPLAVLIDAAGGYAGAPQRLWYGGSLTGRAVPDDALPLTKAMNCIVAATSADLRAPGPERPCIRCGDCARICPAALLPQELHRAVRSGNDGRARAIRPRGLHRVRLLRLCLPERDSADRAVSRGTRRARPPRGERGERGAGTAALRASRASACGGRGDAATRARAGAPPGARPVGRRRLMRFETAPAPHVVAGFTVPRVMFLVLLALLPVAIAHVVMFGPGLVLQLAVAGPVALGCEAAALKLRGRAAAPALADGSVLVTAALLALSLPPLLPWWLTATGTAIAVLLGKHVYGGLGYNPFNPAMVGYAVLLISVPEAMSRWPLPAERGGRRLDDARTSDSAELLFRGGAGRCALGRLDGGDRARRVAHRAGPAVDDGGSPRGRGVRRPGRDRFLRGSTSQRSPAARSCSGGASSAGTSRSRCSRGSRCRRPSPRRSTRAAIRARRFTSSPERRCCAHSSSPPTRSQPRPAIADG